ncbi:MAG: LptF/LptG family permease [Myxococcaceae bacterium]|nr:LptF/LptG family permease [Myxococcaceae bacterium]
MHRIDRYLFGEIFGPFITALAFLFTLLFAMQMLRGIEVMLGASVAATDLLYVAVCLIPHFVVMAVPISFLFAVVIGIGRLTEDREIMALKASGVSPSRLWVAPVTLASILAAIGIAFGYGPEPIGLAEVDRHINELIKKNMAGDVKPGVFYDALRGITLYAQEVDPHSRRFSNVLLVDERAKDDSTIWLARTGYVEPHGSDASLLLQLSEGEIHRAAEHAAGEHAASTVADFERCTLNIQAKELLKKNRFGATRREAMLPGQLKELAQELRDEAQKLRAQADLRREEALARQQNESPFLTAGAQAPLASLPVSNADGTPETASSSSASPEPDSGLNPATMPLTGAVNAAALVIDKSRPDGTLQERAIALKNTRDARKGDQLKKARSKEREARKLDVARARRLAAPLASIVFALCAVPLATGRRQRGQGLGIMTSLGCYVGYYTLARLGEGLGESGSLPAMLAAQLPNIAFLMVGLFLVRRSLRVM